MSSKTAKSRRNSRVRWCSCARIEQQQVSQNEARLASQRAEENDDGADGGAAATFDAMAASAEAASAEQVRSFEEAFHKIKEATGISDIQELVRTFIRNEDQNFSLFNYANEQSNEIEKLEEQVAALKEEEVRFAQEGGDDTSQHKQLLRDLIELRHESMAERYE